MFLNRIHANVAFAAFILLFTVAFPSVLLGQIDTGGVTGTVMDPSRAVVPGAKIALTNQATNIAIQTVSTSAGTYSLTGVQPGVYTLRAVAPGFQTVVSPGLQVHIQNTLTVDIQLVPGAVTEEVTVTAAPPLLQAENASIGQTVETETLNDIPLNGRNWDSLAQLSAGTATAPPGGPTGDSGSTTSAYFSVNGVSLWQNDFRLNGINDNIEVYGGANLGRNAAIVPPPDAIQEFKLQSGDFSAEFGHSTGGVVNAVLKSGTNTIHGDLWEYLRNDLFDANLYFNSKTHTPKSEYRQNQFGGTVGGPVIIPRLYNGKDKTFFFFDYEGLRMVSPSAATSSVPTANMTNSGFTNLQDLITYRSGTGTDGLGRTFPHGTILDPATTRSVAAGAVDPISGLQNTGSSAAWVRDPFYSGGSIAGTQDFTSKTAYLNMLPTQRLDSNAIKLLGLYPVPTSAGLSSNYYRVPKSPTTGNAYDIRIDHSFGPKNRIFGVYDRALRDNDQPGALPGIAVGQSGSLDNSYPAYAIALGETTMFSPTLINEAHIGFLHIDQLIQNHYGNTMGIPAQYGINGVPQIAGNGGLPPISLSGLTGLGEKTYRPTISKIYSIEAADSVTWVHGRSTYKFGVQVDDLTSNITQPPYGRGQFSFNGQFTDIPGKNSSLNGIADFLLTPTASTVGGIDNVGGLSSLNGSNFNNTRNRRWYTALYFQDDWKVTDKLTANLGARWDLFSPYADTRGKEANFVQNNGNGNTGVYYVHQNQCATVQSLTSFMTLLASSNISLMCTPDNYLGSSQKLNFAPRVGFAYRITPQLVVRSGYAIEYGALGNVGYGGTLGTNYPFYYIVSFSAPDTQHPLVLPNASQTATIENALVSINLSDPSSNNGQGLSLYGRQLNYQTPYVQVMNLTVQDQLTQHDSIQAGYIGTLGRHLNSMEVHNAPSTLLPTTEAQQNYVPFPSFARNTNWEVTNANSGYHSLQVTYQHQLYAGLSLLGNYTWSKCMSNQRTQSSTSPSWRAPWLPGFGIGPEYALCDTDAAHIVHISGAYSLPFGTGKTIWPNANKIANAVIGGWQMNAIYSKQTGQPLTVSCPVATSEFSCFAPLKSGVDPYAGSRTIAHWLNYQAFTQPAAVTQIGQTDYSPLGGKPQQVRGPGLSNVDASIFKYFNVSDSVRLQFRAEAFDLTNTPAFAQPGSLNFTAPSTFAQITGTKNGPRRVQFALKLFY
jgi:hypothetical protein